MAALLTVLVVAATGCGAGNPLDPPAATIGKTVISDDVLQGDIDAEVSGDLVDGPNLKIEGASDGTYRSEVVTAKLADRVRHELLGRLLRREGIAVSEEQRTSAKQQLCGTDPQTGQAGDCASFEAYPADYQEFQETLVARELAVAETMATGIQEQLQADYDALIEARDDSLAQSCFDFAAFGTQEEAATAAERASQGVELSDLTEQYQGGQCLPFTDRDQLAPELAEIPDGAISAPLADPSGFFVLIRRTDGIKSIEQYIEEEGPTDLSALVDSILKDKLGNVSVRVDPRYGRWDEDKFRVVGNELPGGVEPTQDSTQQTAPAGQ